MTTAQKTIKYLALAFAVFLIVTIFSAIFNVIYSLSSIFDNSNDSDITATETITGEDITGNINTLNIDLRYSKLIIKKGETLKAETSNKYIKSSQIGSNLNIKEESHGVFSKHDNETLILYIPEDTNFDKVEINAGAGEIDIDALNASNLDFDIGAGKVTIKKLYVKTSASIDGGAGKMEILDGAINNLDLDMGVGKTVLTSLITGRSNIDAGVGALDINLLAGEESYSITVTKGIGSILINGDDTKDNTTYGTGNSTITVDGGIGSINISSRTYNSG